MTQAYTYTIVYLVLVLDTAVYITPLWGGLLRSIARQPRGCQHRMIHVFGKLSARCFQRRPFWHRWHCSNFEDVEHGKSAGGVCDVHHRKRYHTPLGRFAVVDISTVGKCRCQKGRRWKHLSESFPKTYCSVSAPSRLSSNRPRKAAL